MKRLLACLLALSVALSLAGCGGDGWTSPDSAESYYVDGQDEVLARLRELGAGDALLNRLGSDGF